MINGYRERGDFERWVREGFGDGLTTIDRASFEGVIKHGKVIATSNYR
ncbi:MAG: hypothetical protein JJE19_07290 [Methanosarcinales archaeon]|nr:hypothetical protein [Methanosarcinales archaeon]